MQLDPLTKKRNTKLWSFNFETNNQFINMFDLEYVNLRINNCELRGQEIDVHSNCKFELKNSNYEIIKNTFESGFLVSTKNG